ncbi:unnamed protein product, partial [Closterium sp. NIES-53]
MASQCLVSGLPRVFRSLPPSPAAPCTPCIEGRLRATPHSSSLHLATAPFETLHLNVWGPAPRPGPERESFFLVFVDDNSQYTTVFPLAKKSAVTSTLIRLLLATETTRGRRVSCLHSDRGGEFRSGILAGFCREQGITQVFTYQSLDRVPWCCVGFSCLGLPCACPRHLCGQALDSCPPCIFLGFPVDSSDYTFYHPPLHRFFDSCDVRFDDSVPYYTWYPCQGLPITPSPLFLPPSPPPAPAPLVHLPPPGPASS